MEIIVEILDIIPEEVHVILKIRVTELDLLKTVLDKVEIVINKDNEKEVRAASYLTTEFYPFIEKTLKSLGG
jgi:hypothetical protein